MGGVVEWTFYSELAPDTPGVHVCPVYDCAIDHDEKDCHFLMPDLSITHQDAPENWKDRPHREVVEELLKYHVRWWNDPRLDAWPFLERLGGPLRMAQAGKPENVRKTALSVPPISSSLWTRPEMRWNPIGSRRWRQ